MGAEANERLRTRRGLLMVANQPIARFPHRVVAHYRCESLTNDYVSAWLRVMGTGPALCVQKPKIIRKLRKRYCQALELFGARSVPVWSSGAFFLVDRSDYMADRIAIDGSWEPDLVNHLAEISRRYRFDYFVDVGANIGFYAILFAAHRLVPNVMAFEPLPRNYRALVRNVTLNGLSGTIEVFPWALGDEDAEVVIAEGDSGMRSNGVIGPGAVSDLRHAIRQVRFDDRFSINSCSMLFKIDIEGREGSALEAMGRTLRENRCYLQIETFESNFHSVVDLLLRKGYVYVGAANRSDHYFTNIPELRA
jgi:FkbM family methyltransferase